MSDAISKYIPVGSMHHGGLLNYDQWGDAWPEPIDSGRLRGLVQKREFVQPWDGTVADIQQARWAKIDLIMHCRRTYGATMPAAVRHFERMLEGI